MSNWMGRDRFQNSSAQHICQERNTLRNLCWATYSFESLYTEDNSGRHCPTNLTGNIKAWITPWWLSNSCCHRDQTGNDHKASSVRFARTSKWHKPTERVLNALKISQNGLFFWMRCHSRLPKWIALPFLLEWQCSYRKKKIDCYSDIRRVQTTMRTFVGSHRKSPEVDVGSSEFTEAWP